MVDSPETSQSMIEEKPYVEFKAKDSHQCYATIMLFDATLLHWTLVINELEFRNWNAGHWLDQIKVGGSKLST